MQSFLAKCAAVGIVAGGFTLTGDLGRLADRGRRLLEARTVPSETTPEPPAASGTAAAAAPVAPGATAVAAAPVAPDAAAAAAGPTMPEPARSPGRVPAADAPVGLAVAVPPPPASGPESLDLSRLSAGRRVLVWVKRTGGPGRARSIDLVAFDVIDAASGEALEHRHAALSHGGEAPVHAPPRRVVVGSESGGRISKTAPLRVAPLLGVNGVGRAEDLGTVVAIDLADR